MNFNINEVRRLSYEERMRIRKEISDIRKAKLEAGEGKKAARVGVARPLVKRRKKEVVDTEVLM